MELPHDLELPAVPETVTAATTRITATRRDPRLDVLRGLCLLSMVFGHLAANRWIDDATHPLRVVDGAAGFVLLSGVVLGRVQQRRPNLLAPLRRARTIWLAHVGLVLGAITVREITGRPDYIPSVEQLGGIGSTVVDVALLRAQPDWFAVLPFYVVALLITPLVVHALTRGLARWVAAGSVLLWLLSQQGTWNPASTYGAGRWDWAGWQLLFVLGLVAGWHWERLVTLGARFRTHLLAVGAVAAVVGAVLGHVLPVTTEPTVFDKLEVGPGVPVMVLLLAAPAYWAVGRLPLRATAVLARTGANSLRGFVVLCAVQFLLSAFWVQRPVVASLAIIALVVLAAWAGPKRSPVLTSVPVTRSLVGSATREAGRDQERSAA